LAQQGCEGITELIVLHEVVAQVFIGEGTVQQLVYERMVDGGVPVLGVLVPEFIGKAHAVSS
jgi:hypothetical protein